MTRPLTVAAVLDGLGPDARARLLAINPHLRAKSERAAEPRPARVLTNASAPVAVVSPGRVDVLVPGLRLDVTANSRLHWSARSRAVKAQRAAVGAALAGVDLPRMENETALRVEMTRIGPRALDTDNAAGALKAPRDAIAEALGLSDDADPRVEWVCAQALPHTTWRYGLRVVIRNLTGGAMRKPKTIEERFWPKVEKSDGCWLWRGGNGQGGYGWISLGRKVDGGEATHRVSWRLHFGDIPDGAFVCHRCDVRRCVNPTHLFLGTHEDNMRDMREKGRAPSGDRHGRRINPSCVPVGEQVATAKLTDAVVAEILAAYFAGGVTAGELAERYGVTRATASKIVRGDGWTHVPRPAAAPSPCEVAAANLARCRPRGESSGAAKLTAAQVVSIREEYAAGGVTQRELARRHGVTQTAIFYVLRGRNWRAA